MRELDLPNTLSTLVEQLQVVQFSWQGIPIQLPKFAVYAVLDNPVFDRYFYRNGRKMAIVTTDKYSVPVIDPFRGRITLSLSAIHVVTVSVFMLIPLTILKKSLNCR
jgi:hypothetical protein